MTSHPRDLTSGAFSAVYFNRAQEIAARNPREVTMQFFQRKENTVFAGGDFALVLLRQLPDFHQLKVKILPEGSIVQPWEPVMTIKGFYHIFAHLESPLLGVLARPSRVATNTRRVVEAANGKPVFMFADRFDLPDNQAFDGYAAALGGASAVCTEAMEFGAHKFSVPAIGTMPHALIAYHDGDVVEACRSFREAYPEVPLHALVDFNNDCVGDSLRCLEEFGDDLRGVRLDTSGNMVDVSLQGRFDLINNKGVNASLVRTVRQALDEADGQHVEITVSGGFSTEKIAEFEAQGVPVTNYAVGSSLLKNPIDFTADIVVPCAKEGRSLQPSDRLVEVI